MKEHFEEQLEAHTPLTKTSFEGGMSHTYFNGDEKRVGDVVLFAMVEVELHASVELIALNERHFDLFEIDKNKHRNGFLVPYLKRK